MVKRLIASLATIAVAFLASTGLAFAAVEANTADQAALESVKGLGPSLSAKIVAERKKSAFKDWGDFEGRVVGVGEKNAARFSENGLTVAGQPKNGASAARPDAKGTRPAGRKAGDMASAENVPAKR